MADSQSNGVVAWNRGGELPVFDSQGRIFMIPFVPMSAEDAKFVAGSWAEFAGKIEL